MTAKVSVLVPSHNSAEYLADALRSVQDQTLRDFECLVVDDASTDDSRAIAKKFVGSDPRFKLLSLKENKGAAAARNAGLAKVSGEWIALLDADDLYLPERLELLIRIGDAESADIVFDDQLITTYPRTISTSRAFGFPQSTFAFTQEDFFVGSRLFRRSLAMGYMKPLIRRKYLSQSKAAFDPSVPSGEDFLFYAHLFALRPRCIGTSFAGYIYRRRRGSLSRSDTHLHYHSQLGQRILTEFGPELSSHSRVALAARGRDFEQLAHALPALSALRRQDLVGFFRSLIKRPRAIITCLRLGRMRVIRSLSAFSRASNGPNSHAAVP